MELRTQAIDRVLEALAPALSAELDRIIQEAQQNLEAEFQKKLQAAVREAEAASKQSAEVQLGQAVAETRAAVRKQVTEEMQAQFSKTLQERLQERTDRLRVELTNEFQKASAEWMAERTRLTDQVNEFRLLADAQQHLVDAGSQSEILERFLTLAERFAPSIAVYISKADGLALWKSRGNTVFPPIVSPGAIDPELFFRQIMVRDKLVAAACAAKPYKVEGLSFLTACLERSIESFGLKLRTPIPKPSAPEPPREPLRQPPPVETADEKMHAEARRLARLLVSEIKLYHEQEVRDGRANSDLYLRLQNEIEGCREQYRQKVSSGVLGTSDYIHEEIVRVLAENDLSRLGSRYPGPQEIRRGANGR